MNILDLNASDAAQSSKIPFSIPSRDTAEINYVLEAMQSNHRHGAGAFTARATAKLREITTANKILLTHSCTGALELAMLLLDINPGDEVIMPSFTFSSTANAVVLRGATPVFADIRMDTQCIDPDMIEQLITNRTRAILPVHYAGVGCEMDKICRIANKYSLAIIEDAAQAIGASYNGIPLGRFGQLGALSFHDSKNISSGEGGALLINDESLADRAEIFWEKGTNRHQFSRGLVDKYTWVDMGSSFLPSEVTAAFLLGQLERTEAINRKRIQIWDTYFSAFAEAEQQGICVRPYIPANCVHNGHIFYLILPNISMRNALLAHLQNQGISATFHYIPLHDSTAGKKFGRTPLPLPNTDRAGHSLVRLPLFPDLSNEQQQRIIEVVNDFMLRKLMRVASTN